MELIQRASGLESFIKIQKEEQYEIRTNIELLIISVKEQNIKPLIEIQTSIKKILKEINRFLNKKYKLEHYLIIFLERALENLAQTNINIEYTIKHKMKSAGCIYAVDALLFINSIISKIKTAYDLLDNYIFEDVDSL